MKLLCDVLKVNEICHEHRARRSCKVVYIFMRLCTSVYTGDRFFDCQYKILFIINTVKVDYRTFDELEEIYESIN